MTIGQVESNGDAGLCQESPATPKDAVGWIEAKARRMGARIGLGYEAGLLPGRMASGLKAFTAPRSPRLAPERATERTNVRP